MAEAKHQCVYCEHVMGERFMAYDEKEHQWYCKSTVNCVHRMKIAREHPRPPRGYAFMKQSL